MKRNIQQVLTTPGSKPTSLASLTMMDDEELKAMVEAAITETGAANMQDMGKVIGLVKSRAGATADGGRIATLVKEKLSA